IAHMPEPLLYVTKDSVPDATAKALEGRSGKASIYVLGPESAVSAKVEDALKQYGTVTRISGSDPYRNAIAFAKFKDSSNGFGWGITTPGHNVSFVTTDSPALAIAAAPFSHLGKHAPLLFTEKSGMPDSVMGYLMELMPKFKESPAEGPYNHAWITGDSSAITAKAQSEIDDMLEISPASGENPHSGH
ncbi:cell wall-binding repeat-containing protein, partial [Paenibacillus zanthoxyli]|uniref:cell wall-binding repeat-containing protein n=1 Tax=Paenibacillus zanthoxyli TaxID=369399 RepID=UPI00046F0710